MVSYFEIVTSMEEQRTKQAAANQKHASAVIVGRPNVGKSTLFNRIIGKRDAIVDDQPGVTRDSKFKQAEWRGKGFWLVDTGGFFGPDDDPLSPAVQEQIERTARTASVLIMILDAQTGPTPLDSDVLDLLRRFHIPIVAAVNKVDNPAAEWELIAPFYELGFSEIFPISAMHGTGTGDMLDAVVEYLPDDAPFEPEPIPGIAIIGRPNVGKSTLLNGLCGTDRSIVSPIAGTTRDPVDTEIEVNGKRYLLIDTAGIRRRGKMSQGLDRYSLLRAKKALDRCDLALMLINAEEGLTESDAVYSASPKTRGKRRSFSSINGIWLKKIRTAPGPSRRMSVTRFPFSITRRSSSSPL